MRLPGSTAAPSTGLEEICRVSGGRSLPSDQPMAVGSVAHGFARRHSKGHTGKLSSCWQRRCNRANASTGLDSLARSPSTDSRRESLMKKGRAMLSTLFKLLVFPTATHPAWTGCGGSPIPSGEASTQMTFSAVDGSGYSRILGLCRHKSRSYSCVEFTHVSWAHSCDTCDSKIRNRFQISSGATARLDLKILLPGRGVEYSLQHPSAAQLSCMVTRSPGSAPLPSKVKEPPILSWASCPATSRSPPSCADRWVWVACVNGNGC